MAGAIGKDCNAADHPSPRPHTRAGIVNRLSGRFAPSCSGPWRKALIVGGVIALHAAVLTALDNGLPRRAAQVLTPVEIIGEFVDPPQPAELAPPPAPPQPRPEVKPPRPAPRLPAIRTPSPAAPDAPAGAAEPAPPSQDDAPALSAPEPAAPAAASSLPAAPAAPPAVQLPSADADYARSCKPVYPSMSKRLGEQGRAIVRVLVGTDGLPRQVDIKQSSGFDRLDTAARAAMLRCRFIPGKVDGVAQSMAYDAPVNFVLH